MATNPVCCGCHFVDDYGTSTVQGTGSLEEPFSVNMVDPDFIRPMVRVSKSTNTVITANVPVTIQFNTEVFDSAFLWDISLPSRIVFPIDGVYLIGMQTEIISGGGAPLGSGDKSITLLLNGSIERYKATVEPASVLFLSIELVYSLVVSANDYMEMVVESSTNNETTGSATRAASQTTWATYLGKVV